MVSHAEMVYLKRLKALEKARKAKKAYARAGGARRRPQRRMRGKGFLDVIKKASNLASKVNQFAKENKLASKALGVADVLGVREKISSNPLGSAVLSGLELAKEKGYGRKKRVGRPRARAKRVIRA